MEHETNLVRWIALSGLLIGLASAGTVQAQEDPAAAANRRVKEATNGLLSFTLEERTRWEEKDGVNFGKSVNQQDMLSRLRFGVDVEPADWLKGM